MDLIEVEKNIKNYREVMMEVEMLGKLILFECKVLINVLICLWGANILFFVVQSHVIKNVFISQGTFDLEEWKRFYSNNEEEDSVKYFWQHFDPDHYSIWRGDYR